MRDPHRSTQGPHRLGNRTEQNLLVLGRLPRLLSSHFSHPILINTAAKYPSLVLPALFGNHQFELCFALSPWHTMERIIISKKMIQCSSLSSCLTGQCDSIHFNYLMLVVPSYPLHCHHLPGPQHRRTTSCKSFVGLASMLASRHSVEITMILAVALAFIDRAKSGLLKRARSCSWNSTRGV